MFKPLRTRTSDNPNCYVVHCCGCTDCFPQAIFRDEEMATQWAEKECKNPESYIIEEAFIEFPKVILDEW